ncbi:TRIC cation channel family protein [Photobacterium sp. DNB23_23_1]|uniref:TRIC cation channel family protein n=1 Tax=Photobacterium pectinilyticum TaxID=2906793 RepID=A0ABT1N2H4_9GAMM|nr:TRIC cation channel family protein [Photobacterium sp. ZSDE20]MCQ1058928.1 TRIC cation channel family protein [Photobacterium sp. ZSDE20]MDD1823963.1 TRIC cation channel family protein [Photobacterium sp. ZSDE20]
MLIYVLDMFGTAVFAASGVLLAGRLRMDPFGVVVLASVTAIGGGTIRDMALGATPVFWITDTNYLWVIFITCLISMLAIRRPRQMPWWILPVSDAIGLAVFVAIGVEKALRFGATPMVAVIMGVMTGCGGGVIRDVLAREIPMVLRTEVYATACILGGIIHTVSLSANVDSAVATLAGIITTLTIRLAAIRWHLSLPTFAIRH